MKKATVRELRHYLFDNNFSVVINDITYTNKDARRYLFDIVNQDQAIEYKVITKNKDMKTKIENFLMGLNTEIDVISLIDIDNINFNNAFNSIMEMIEDNDGFNMEVIYFSNAIDFLQKNDCSLMDSIELASELGYSTKDLNSELLATLLYSSMIREEFYELEDEINEFFEELEEEEEEEN